MSLDDNYDDAAYAAAAAANAAAAVSEAAAFAAEAEYHAQEIVTCATEHARGLLHIITKAIPVIGVDIPLPSLVRLLHTITDVKKNSFGFKYDVNVDDELVALMIALKPMMMNDTMDNELDECVRMILQLGDAAQYPETPVLNRLREG